MSEGELSPKDQAFMDSISPIDKYGFTIRQDLHWLPETREDEITRLTWNQLIYEQFMLNGSTFPPEVGFARAAEAERLQQLTRNQK